jgi:hypothetical protein
LIPWPRLVISVLTTLRTKFSIHDFRSAVKAKRSRLEKEQPAAAGNAFVADHVEDRRVLFDLTQFPREVLALTI